MGLAGDASGVDRDTGDVESGSDMTRGEYTTDESDRIGFQGSIDVEQSGDGRSDKSELHRSCRGFSLGIATVVRGDLRVVKSLDENEPKFSISSAIDGRWDNSGEFRGSTDVERSEDDRNDERGLCSRGDDCSSRGDSSLVAAIIM